jgi:peptide chain release factor 2
MINPKNILIETVTQSKRGGQHTGDVSCGVKVTHIPTGLKAFCDSERSQMRNRDVCIAMLEYGMAEIGVRE